MLCNGNEPAADDDKYRGITDEAILVSLLNRWLEERLQYKEICSKLGWYPKKLKKTIEKYQNEGLIKIRVKLSKSNGYDELYNLVDQLSSKSGRTHGGRFIHGAIEAKGYAVNLNLVKEILSEVDPIGVFERFNGRLLKRVPYSVKGPLSLIHIDGCHKLIDWKFVIHGGVDGYSRFITFMDVRTNNRAETMFESFFASIQAHGLPSRVRGDFGVENVKICRYMHLRRGCNRGSFIAGPSKNNTRIERLWRDVANGFQTRFHNLFVSMEMAGILQRYIDVHLAVLHLVYLPWVKKECADFVDMWNHHRVSSNENKPPKSVFAATKRPGFQLDLCEHIVHYGDQHEDANVVLRKLMESPNNVSVDSHVFEDKILALVMHQFGNRIYNPNLEDCQVPLFREILHFVSTLPE